MSLEMLGMIRRLEERVKALENKLESVLLAIEVSQSSRRTLTLPRKPDGV